MKNEITLINYWLLHKRACRALFTSIFDSVKGPIYIYMFFTLQASLLYPDGAYFLLLVP